VIKLPNIKGLATMGKAAVAAHRPEILLGTSLVSTVAAVVSAGFAGYKSGQQVLLKEMGHEPEEMEDVKVQVLPVKEKIQLTWMNYLPSAGLAGAALGSTTGLHLVHVKEKKALAAAALMAIEEIKTEAKQYQDQLVDAVDANVKSEKTKQKIADDAIDPNGDGIADILPSSDHEVDELYLVRDAKTGRDIWSNTLRIEEACNAVNNFIAKHGDCDLNSFYSNAGFENTPDGDDWGWSGAWVELKWDTTVRDDGRPVKRFAFRTDPEKGYDRPV
jgi:hypothetical protein